MTEPLSTFDIKILEQLQKDCSVSTVELAEIVGLSQSPCWRRLQRLKDEGYIKSQVAILELVSGLPDELPDEPARRGECELHCNAWRDQIHDGGAGTRQFGALSVWLPDKSSKLGSYITLQKVAGLPRREGVYSDAVRPLRTVGGDANGFIASASYISLGK